jgi:phage antirepressor YoqD-like protein
MLQDLTNLFTDNSYLIPSKFKQENGYMMKQKNMTHEMFKVGEESQGYLEA